MIIREISRMRSLLLVVAVATITANTMTAAMVPTYRAGTVLPSSSSSPSPLSPLVGSPHRQPRPGWTTPRTTAPQSSICTSLNAQAGGSDDGDDNKKDIDSKETKNPLELASWYAVEAFGKAFAPLLSDKPSSSSTSSSDAIDLALAPSSLEETLQRIRLDNDRSYFLSGEVDALIYDDECTFADPFVSFDGRDRFIENLANLGSFITKYDARVLKYDVEDSGSTIVTKVMVKLELNLPWKPVLAWPWGVTYSVDNKTFLVTDHIESWDVEAWEGVKQIFRKPTVKVKGE